MEVVIAFLIGGIAGAILVRTLVRNKPVGTLRIDRSDPDDGPYLFLELGVGIHHIEHKKQVVLRVNNENYISQK